MPPPWEACLGEKAVYWEWVGFGGDGKVRVAAVPVEIDVERTDGQTAGGPRGVDTLDVDATVTTDRLLVTGSKVWLGRLEDLRGKEWPIKDEPLYWVAWAKRSLCVKGRDESYQAGLKFSKDALPPLPGDEV